MDDTVDIQQDGGQVVLAVRGVLGLPAVERLWGRITRIIRSGAKEVVVNGEAMSGHDDTGVAFLGYLKRQLEARGGVFRMEGMPEALVGMVTEAAALEMPRAGRRGIPGTRVLSDVGEATYRLAVDVRQQVGFLGELMYAGLQGLTGRRRLRWGSLFLTAERAGVNAIGIISLMGFLIGLILAFQSAVPMRMFGAEVFAADLVALSMFRELGPLMTAFILASRSGSAFAAELGTMKVDEELDAMLTFGIDPMQFLVMPRVVAVVLVAPVLTLVNNLFSLLGALVVMRGLGFTSVVYWDRVTSAADMTDLAGGLVKALVFGFLIGSVGCLRGMQTGNGPSAVGESATRAVVTSIILIVAADFIFAVVYYFLGI